LVIEGEDMREGYKKTELGEIPVEWEVKKLKDIVIGKGEYGIGASATEYVEGKPRYLRISDIGDNSELLKEDIKGLEEDNYFKYLLEENDIVFARTGNTTGKSYLYHKKDGELVYAGFLIRFKINSSIMDSRFVKYYTQCKKYWDWVKTVSTRSGQPGINSKQYSELNIPIPPLKEQQKIADILSTVDRLIEQTDALIEKTKELKKGLMQRLLTKGIGHTEFKKTEIGEIPVEWEVKKLKEIGEIVTGNTPKTSEPENYGNEYLWVSPADMGEHKYIYKTNKMLSFIGFNKTRKIPKGSILVTCIGSTIGKIGIASEELSTNQQINSLICNVKYNNEYVYYAISYNFKKYISFISIQAVPIINKTVYSEFMIPIPPKEEQDRIANILSEIDIKIENYNVKKQKLQTLKQGLMQKLLTGKIRVKVS